MATGKWIYSWCAHTCIQVCSTYKHKTNKQAHTHALPCNKALGSAEGRMVTQSLPTAPDCLFCQNELLASLIQFLPPSEHSPVCPAKWKSNVHWGLIPWWHQTSSGQRKWVTSAPRKSMQVVVTPMTAFTVTRLRVTPSLALIWTRQESLSQTSVGEL